MEISNLTLKPLAVPTQTAKAPTAAVPGFGKLLQESLDRVNSLQQEADRVTEQYLAGQVQDLHQVMVSSEKANLALQMTLEIRNKVIEAYQEISRMQL